MDFFSVLALLGGLAIFLYGMNLMGDGLAKVAGGKLERILETLTSNPIRAVLLGMGVTAVIQSSSATTVMVVGFVNSGIMKLSQVVGIIMGANIGTTVTSWILSLTGIQSDNFIIRLFKPTSFSPILGTDRRGSDHVYKKPEEKGRGSDLCRLCDPDVWNECHERSCGTSCRGTGVYRNAGEILQSDPWSCWPEQC